MIKPTVTSLSQTGKKNLNDRILFIYSINEVPPLPQALGIQW